MTFRHIILTIGVILVLGLEVPASAVRSEATRAARVVMKSVAEKTDLIKNWNRGLTIGAGVGFGLGFFEGYNQCNDVFLRVVSIHTPYIFTPGIIKTPSMIASLRFWGQAAIVTSTSFSAGNCIGDVVRKLVNKKNR